MKTDFVISNKTPAFFASIWLLLLMLSFSAEFPEAKTTEIKGVIIDTNYATSKLGWLLAAKSAKPFVPKQQEIDAAERSLAIYIVQRSLASDITKSELKQFTTVREGLVANRRQYVGLQFAQKRILHINAFPPTPKEGEDPFADWKRRYIHVADGGPAFWQAEYDIDAKQIVIFQTNESA